MDLKVSMYNCRGLPKSKQNLALRPDIIKVLGEANIVALQETWYSKQDLSCINSLHEGFVGTGAAKIDESNGLIQGRYSGGVAFLWNIDMSKHIKILDIKVDWCIAIEVNLGSSKFVLFNVYMPYQAPENEDLYFERLGWIKCFIDEINCTNFAVIGDWNANLGNTGTMTFKVPMLEFCEENDLLISSQMLLPESTYTHVHSYLGDQHYSWLDHIVSSHDFHQTINNILVHYDMSDEDHIPVSFNIHVDLLPSLSQEINDLTSKVKWDSVSDADRNIYYRRSHDNLGKVNLPISALCCNNTACEDKSHRLELEVFYNNIVEALKLSSDHLTSSNKQNFNKPGWSDYVADLYEYSRETYRLWLDNGKPRQDIIHKEYTQSRQRFKYALRFIKKHEDELRKESIAKKYCDNNPRAMWKEINTANNSKVPLPSTIDNITGNEEIVKLWKNHYQGIFNCIKQNESSKSKIEVDCHVDDLKVTIENISEAVNKLDNNKSCGADSIYAEHLKYCSEKIYTLLSMCLTGFFVHGYLPESLLTVILVPVIKNKAGNINSKDNYRPIALASIISKVIENIILVRIQDQLESNPNQFGFKRRHGTDQCIYALKEVINLYTSLKGCVYSCFLDASKAFDRVNHSILFEKLAKRGIPAYIRRILIFWYQHQKMCVKWGSLTSDLFSVSNGVRQGSILSPHFFNVYVDDLSTQLNKLKIGCLLGDFIINHLLYADDIVLISPSSVGLKKLLSVCEKFGDDNDMLFNASKSAIMLSKSSYMPYFHIPTFRLNGNSIDVVQKFKYLGHFVSANMSDKEDIERQRKKLYAQGNSLIRKFHMCTLDTKLVLFNTYCSAMYTAQLWTNYTNTSINKLYTAYHNILKSFIGVNKREYTSPICVNLNVRNCPAVIRNLVFRFMNRLQTSSNVIISSIYSSSCFYKSQIWKHWRFLLYIS